MSFCRLVFAMLFIGSVPAVALAQSAQDDSPRLFLELNAVQEVGEACRLTFLARNETGVDIDKAVFESVIFDSSGGVVSLTLYDFRDLPANRPRVRQFDLANRTCDSVGQALINGASSCVVDGAESEICNTTLSLSSRLEIELLG